MAAGLWAEVGSCEVARLEVAGDGTTYADIESASSLTFAGNSVLGLWADIAASAALGVTDSLDSTAVFSTNAEGEAEFDAAADGAVLVQARGTGRLEFNSPGSMGYAVATVGAATLEFQGFADPVTDPDGLASLSFAAAADGSALVRFAGTSEAGFMGSASMVAVTWLDGASQFSFAATAVGAVAFNRRASARWEFSHRGRMGALAGDKAAANLEFGHVGRMQAVAWVEGAALAEFIGAAVGSHGLFAPTAGAGVLDTTAVAVGQAAVHADAASQLLVQAEASMGRVVWAEARAQLEFEARGRPGASLFPSLPAAREGWVVPAAQDPWVVPKDVEFGEV